MAKREPKTRREIVARALCWYDGHPENTKFERRPMWESYLDQADFVLKALDEADEASETEWSA